MERLLDREFTIADTHSFPGTDNFSIRKTSAGLGWKLAFMSVQEEGPYSKHFPARCDVLISVVNHGTMKGVITAQEVENPLNGGPGTISIIPGHGELSCQSRNDDMQFAPLPSAAPFRSGVAQPLRARCA